MSSSLDSVDARPRRSATSRRFRAAFTTAAGVALAATVATAGLLITGAPVSAAAQFTLLKLDASVSGSAVTATATIAATSTTTQVQVFGICVRSSTGANLDYPKATNVAVPTTGYTVSGTKTFAVGTYTYFACVEVNSSWVPAGATNTFTVAPAAATAPAPAAPSSPSGQAMPVGDLSGWKQVLAEDFTNTVALGGFPTSSYKNEFYPYSGFPDTSKHGVYNPTKVVSTSGGLLDYYLHTEGSTHYVNSLVAKVPATKWGQTYGRYSVRFRADNLPGYKLAFMLWPDSDKWVEGEVDFPEVNALTSNEYMYANRYQAGRTNLTTGTTGFKTNIPASGNGWHTATIEWSPNNLTYYLDGAKLGTTTSGIPSTKMHWVLQAETRVNNAAAPANTVAGHLQIDWVTIYSRV
ncbi:glycoside hydrolase family 16 protein [Jatrophihabitans telluris]|uniref:Glycoside hydrolase family 16 protein n=1 Tax=Jatrophihabitans telluris TaxID=2038343 RepID=A0ABY4QYF5_9ACTN|nr:glycoside hydrolase family 16 protein [Jatrophihabitans telluris]UQX87886.1 glycoside hydrolase family 16 protein [Jatrophihabitans telluris]